MSSNISKKKYLFYKCTVVFYTNKDNRFLRQIAKRHLDIFLPGVFQIRIYRLSLIRIHIGNTKPDPAAKKMAKITLFSKA